eukprot:augustus_masked-scaffold_15-processed-gene-7.62-mRNA-1 protein AED:1.00 eAED:1.00 QI:0/-1/0/0/-1/1/1/0/691
METNLYREHLISFCSINDSYKLRTNEDIHGLVQQQQRNGKEFVDEKLTRKFRMTVDVAKNLGTIEVRILRIISCLTPAVFQHVVRRCRLEDCEHEALRNIYSPMRLFREMEVSQIPAASVEEYIVSYVNSRSDLRESARKTFDHESKPIFKELFCFFMDNEKTNVQFLNDIVVFTEEKGLEALNNLLSKKYKREIYIKPGDSARSFHASHASDFFDFAALKKTYKPVGSDRRHKIEQYFQKVAPDLLPAKDILFTWFGFLTIGEMKKILFRIYGVVFKNRTRKFNTGRSTRQLKSYKKHNSSPPERSTSHASVSSNFPRRKKISTINRTRSRRRNDGSSSNLRATRSQNPFEKKGRKVSANPRRRTHAKSQVPKAGVYSPRTHLLDRNEAPSVLHTMRLSNPESLKRKTDLPVPPLPSFNNGSVQVPLVAQSSQSVVIIGNKNKNQKFKKGINAIKAGFKLKLFPKNKGSLINMSDFENLTFTEDPVPRQTVNVAQMNPSTNLVRGVNFDRLASTNHQTAELQKIMKQSMSTKLKLLKGDDDEENVRTGTTLNPSKIQIPLPGAELNQASSSSRTVATRGQKKQFNSPFNILAKKKNKKNKVVCEEFVLCTDEYSTYFGKCETCGFKKSLHLGESFDENEVQSEGGGRPCRRFVGKGNICEQCSFEKTSHQWFAFDLPPQIKNDGLSFEDI